jgi:hypothetical protein
MACKGSGGRLHCQQTASNRTSRNLAWRMRGIEAWRVYLRRRREPACSARGLEAGAKSSHGRAHPVAPF